MSRTMLLLCPLALLLMSCATDGPKTDTVADCVPETKIVTQTRVTDTACTWTSPIYVSKTDVLSDTTAKAILAYDLAGQKNCNWKPSK